MSSDIHVDFLRKSHGKKQKCTERERFQSYLIISLHRIALFCQENHIHSPKHFSTTNCKNDRCIDVNKYVTHSTSVYGILIYHVI